VVGCPTRSGARRPTRSSCRGRVGHPEALREFCRERLAHFKTPHSFTPVTELPKTATGKIQKFVLRQGRPNLSKQ
jgi:fatty-acyl-CoA synthase